MIKPILVTDRDKDILSKLVSYRTLSTEHIYRLCFPSLHRARKRLLQLWQHGYLKRIVRPTRMGEGSSMYLYIPTRKGLALMPDSFTSGGKRVTRYRLSTFFTEHRLRINDFRTCLELAVRNYKDTSLLFWHEGNKLSMRVNIKDKNVIKTLHIIPDAFFTLQQNERTFHYLLEVDRGTADLKRISLKCRAYLNLWQNKIAQSRFGIRSFRILYVTTTKKRASNMLELLQKLQAFHNRVDIIMITSVDAYSLTDPSRIFEPILKTLDTEGRIQNVCLLPTIPLISSRRHAENHHCAVQNPMSTNGTPGLGG